jgi:hypothetical protein
LEEIEEALGEGVIAAVSPPAHGVFQIVSIGEGRPGYTDELRTLIRMDQHAVRRFATIRLPAEITCLSHNGDCDRVFHTSGSSMAATGGKRTDCFWEGGWR